MTDSLVLLPAPRRIEHRPGACPLESGRLILLDAAAAHGALFTARRLAQALRDHTGQSWEIVASMATPPALIGITLSIGAALVRHIQATSCPPRRPGSRCRRTTRAACSTASAR